ncbi:MAG: biotin/lipoyl-binding protein [Chthoniobacter sp.]
MKLHVQDNQAVQEGDVLFEIDPEDYELTLEKAKAVLASLDEQITAARAQDATLKFAVKAAQASGRASPGAAQAGRRHPAPAAAAPAQGLRDRRAGGPGANGETGGGRRTGRRERAPHQAQVAVSTLATR